MKKSSHEVLPRSAVFNGGVESVESNFIFSKTLIKFDTGMLKLVAPHYFTWYVRRSYLQIILVNININL